MSNNVESIMTRLRNEFITCLPERLAVLDAQWVALAAALVVWVFFCAAPLAAIVWRAGMAGSVAWAVLLEESTWQALWNTVRFSALAVVCATLLGLAHALAARQSPTVWPATRARSVLVMLPTLRPRSLAASRLTAIW